MGEQEVLRGPRIAVIGGGTGSFTLLKDLKRYVRDLTALVNMADDGGSTGQLRDELGALPPGDVRQCLVALSNSPRVRELFNYRFEDGALAGHAFGNLFLSALEKTTGSFAEAVEGAGDILDISGRVIPMTLDNVRLECVDTKTGTVTTSQFAIQSMNFGGKRPDLRLSPSAQLNPDAESALLAADLIVIAPGNLYTSLAPALLVDRVSEVVARARAKKVYVCNLVTKPGQTDGFTVSDYAKEIERFMGCKLDYVIYNNVRPRKSLLDKYAHDGEYPVKWDEQALRKAHYRAKGIDLVAKEIWSGASASDPIAQIRTFIRHDADRVARELMRIYFA